MAFTVEDGTGVAGANAYTDVAFVTGYLTERGRETENSWSTSTDAQQKAAIIAATDYIERRFGQRFPGRKEFPDTPQGLSFPRLDIYDREGVVIEGVPLLLKQAVAEYAVRARSAKLQPDPAATGGNVIETRDKVGPIESTIKYAEGTSLATIRAYPEADDLLKPLLGPAGGRLIRA